MNNLSPAQIERLALLIEECAEVQHIACKILRHGYEDFNPDTSCSNRTHLAVELGQLAGEIKRMQYRQDFNYDTFVRKMRDRLNYTDYIRYEENINVD